MVSTGIRFRCPQCSKQVDIEAEVPEVDWSYDSPGDSLSEDDIDLECPHCGASYSAHVQNSPSHCAVELYDYPDVDVDADDAPFAGRDDDSWLNQEVPDEPFEVFMDSYYRLGDIVAEYGLGGRGTLPHSSEVINRMVYASVIGAMEAFLSDLLIHSVLSQEVTLKRLIQNDNELKKSTVSLDEVLSTPNVVTHRVRQYLTGLIYHNLAKISKLYKFAFEIEIFPDGELKDRLMKAVQIRHDLVHRNGKDKIGTTIELPTAVVTSTLEDIHRFARHIDKSVEASLSIIRNAKSLTSPRS